MRETLTDQEIIAGFMEPMPANTERGERGISECGWWERRFSVPNQRFRHWPNSDKTDSLDALHEVEARLTDEQWTKYADLMMDPSGLKHTRFLLHATAEQKIRALAQVLREGAK
jgi:hypothetical protein